MRPVSACGIGSAIQATIMNAATASACLEAGSKFSGANQSSAGTAIVKTKPITFRVEIPISFAPPSCAVACTASAISISLLWRIPLPDQAHRLARQLALVKTHHGHWKWVPRESFPTLLQQRAGLRDSILRLEENLSSTHTACTRQ